MRNPATTKKILEIQQNIGIKGPKMAEAMNITPATFTAKKTAGNTRNWFNKKNLIDLITWLKIEVNKL